jgi:hypothetical protein
MGIRFHCPNGHKINVKSFLAGKRALCPTCGAKVVVPMAADTDAPLAASLVGEIDAQRGVAQPLSAGASTIAPTIPLAAKPLAAEPVLAAEATPFAHRPFTPAVNPSQTATPVPGGAPQGPPPAPPGFRDPIAEAPQAVWYVRPRAGGQYGPAAGDVFRQWVAENRVTPDSYVWRDGWSDWRLASEAIPQLAPVDPYRGMAAPAYVAPTGPAYVAAEAAMAPVAAAVAEVEPAAMAKRPVRIRKTPTSSVLAVGLLALVAVILIAVLVIVVMNQVH